MRERACLCVEGLSKTLKTALPIFCMSIIVADKRCLISWLAKGFCTESTCESSASRSLSSDFV